MKVPLGHGYKQTIDYKTWLPFEGEISASDVMMKDISIYIRGNARNDLGHNAI